MSGHSKVFEVVTIVKERRTYTLEAPDLSRAEEMVMEGDVAPVKVEVEDSFVNHSREIKAAEDVEDTR